MVTVTEPLVGRDADTALAIRCLAAVARGASASLLIEGEAGIGKTRLAQHLADVAHDRGTTVLRGAAHPFEGNRPYGVLATALDLRRRPGPSAADDVVEVVEAATAAAPVLLILEDLHWADDASLAAVRALLQGLRHVPLMLVGTIRPAGQRAELAQLIDDFIEAGGHYLRLGPLAEHEVDALVRAHLGAAAGPTLGAIVDKAGGNPLWVVELLRALAAEGWLRHSDTHVDAAGDELPSTFRDLVLRRLGYLPPGTLDVLELASVLGQAISVSDLATVSRRAPLEVVADLAEAFRARLLDDREDAVVFRHQLVQQAIYEHIPTTVRRALHRDAAGALARAGADLSKVASHLLRGAEGGDLEATRWLRAAAADAMATAPSVAVDLLRRAIEVLPERHRDADLLQAELAEALLQSGHVAAAASTAEAVLDRPHRDDAGVRLSLTLVDALSLQNRAVELTTRAERALDNPALSPNDHALVLAQASYGQTFAGDFGGGEATARRALARAEAAGDAAMTVWARGALSVAVKTQGRYAEALAIARAGADVPGDDARRRHPQFFLGMALADADLFADARVAFARAVDECVDLGTAWLLPDILQQAAQLRFVGGEWDDALAELEAGMELAAARGQHILLTQSGAILAMIATLRGTASPALPPVAPTAYGAELVAYAEALSADAPTVFESLLPVWNHDVAHGIAYYHRQLAPLLAKASLDLGRRDIAENVVDVVDAGAALAPDVPTVQAVALRCRGLLTADGDVLRAAVDLTQDAGRLLDHAGTCEDAASVLGGDDGKELLLEAYDLYAGVGATVAANRCAAALRERGVRQGVRGSRRRAESGWGSLTVSERTVAQLVAEGLTNRETARRLHLSPHTVNTHLRHVFRKLGVASRTELAVTITRSSDVSEGPVGAG